MISDTLVPPLLSFFHSVTAHHIERQLGSWLGRWCGREVSLKGAYADRVRLQPAGAPISDRALTVVINANANIYYMLYPPRPSSPQSV